MKKFIITQGLQNIQRPCLINFTVREDDMDLHLGDKFFLSQIANKLSNAICGDSEATKKYDVYLTLPRRLKHEKGCSIAIDWSARNYLPPEMMILEKLREMGICSNIFYDAKDYERVIVVSSEIASNSLRIFGLKNRMISILKLFDSSGFDIVHIGKEEPNFLLRHGVRVKSIFGLKECEEALSSNRVYAFVGFDNYWMHVALSLGKRAYVIQRRKFFRTNLTNHMCSLNYTTSDTNIITYV